MSQVIPTRSQIRGAMITLHGQPEVRALLQDILDGRWTLVAEDAAPGVRPVYPRDLLITADVRRLCGGISRGTLIAWRASRGFPEPVRSIRTGKGRKAQTVDIYDRRDVRAWLKAHPPLTREIRPGP